MTDGDTIGSEEKIAIAGEKETQEALGLSDEAFEEWKYNQGVRFLSPSVADVLVRAHGQDIYHYAVHYSENFLNTATRYKDGTIESDAPIIGFVDCMQTFEVPKLREVIRHHQFDDKDSVEIYNIKPLESNIVLDYATEFGQRMRKTFVNGRFTRVECDIDCDGVMIVDRYFFEADDIKTEIFELVNTEWVVAASSKTTEVGVIGG